MQDLFQRKRISPLWKAGAIDSDITHTIGIGEADKTENPFQTIKGELRARKTGSDLARELRRRQDDCFIVGHSVFGFGIEGARLIIDVVFDRETQDAIDIKM